MKEYDIAIAGGAMTGTTLALALNDKSVGKLSIAVIEPFEKDNINHPGFDARSIALSYGTQQILDSFQLWRDIHPVATPIKQIHVSDRGHAGMTDMFHHEHGIEALGYVVELADIGRIYHEKLERIDAIHLHCPDSVVSIEQQPSRNILTLSSGEQIGCKLLVAADGADSTCCDLLKVNNTEQDFGQVAVIANIKISEDHQGRAFERFTKSGPLALLPMSDNRMSLVWCLSAKEVESVLALSDVEFLDKLQKDFGWRLGALTQAGQRASYPLKLKQKSKLITHRFVTVGNAAQLLHPIAGQGFNLGIRDVASLVDELIQAEDVGQYVTLSAYQRRRMRDRNTTIDLTAGMVHLFSNDWVPLRIGRNAALMAMDNLPLVKMPLLRQTMGLVKR